MATKKTIPIKPLTSWSFSRYSDYKTCPLKAKLKHIDKIQEPSIVNVAGAAERLRAAIVAPRAADVEAELQARGARRGGG